MIVWVEANVKGRTKEFSWLAKVLRAEAGPANYARFQVTKILHCKLNRVANRIKSKF